MMVNLSGIYGCAFHPDEENGGCWTNYDTILIYLDELQRLSFNFSVEIESNYGYSWEFEEGFVHQEAASREVHFEARQRYEWSAAGGMGYDSDAYRSSKLRPQQSIQIFRLLDQTEIARAREDEIVSDQTEIVLVKQKENLIYEQIDTKGVEAKVVRTRLRLHEHWQDMTEQHVRSKLAQGMPLEEIAGSCDWSIKYIRTLL